KKGEEFPTCTAWADLGWCEGHWRKDDDQEPQNKKTIIKQGFHPRTAALIERNHLNGDDSCLPHLFNVPSFSQIATGTGSSQLLRNSSGSLAIPDLSHS